MKLSSIVKFATQVIRLPPGGGSAGAVEESACSCPSDSEVHFVSEVCAMHK